MIYGLIEGLIFTVQYWRIISNLLVDAFNFSVKFSSENEMKGYVKKLI